MNFMSGKYFAFILLILFSILSIQSCEKDNIPASVNIRLKQIANEKPVLLNEWIYESPAGHPYKIRRLQMLLSDFELHTTNGEIIIYDMYHYFEFSKVEGYNFTLKDIPVNSYNKIVFNFGLDEEKNQNNAYPNDYDMINFKWPSQMGIGYHYMRFEVTADSLGSGVIKDFNIHTGATNGNQNYLTFEIPFDETFIQNQNFTIDLIMDMNQWFKDPLIFDWEHYGQGIMGNQEAQSVLKNNGHNTFTVEGPFLTDEYHR
jgi:hypothetical protein